MFWRLTGPHKARGTNLNDMSPSPHISPKMNGRLVLLDDPQVALYDRWEASLDQSAATRRRLLDALEPTANTLEAAE